LTRVSAGRVGRAHGRDGSFYVEEVRVQFALGDRVHLGEREYEVVRRAGIDDRPIVRLDGLDDPASVRGELLLVEDEIAEDEFLVADLIGCEIEGVGYVERVLDGPSCDVLEVGTDGVLIPLIGDAVKRVDLERRIIEVDREFLGL
jgi:16S rRNA processing protein RimM